MTAVRAESRVLNPAQARAAVARAQEDVRRASSFAHNRGKEQSRFDNAQTSLAKVDKSYSKDRFNKGKLDDAIRDLKGILDHNTISSQDRDALSQDLNDLQVLRAQRD